MTKTEEKSYKPVSGYFLLLINLLLFAGGIYLTQVFVPFAVLCIVLGVLALPGYFSNAPNQSKVLTLFGDYIGTVKKVGFHWANPFITKKSVSLRARNMQTEYIKVNDLLGNPIIIRAVLVWQVTDTAKAVFEVDNYQRFVDIQSEAAVRNLAGSYPYDDFDETKPTVTLRAGAQIVNQRLEAEIAERLNIAGITVMEARISHLAYSEEIAGAMLQRQQATAVVAARREIVEGAVGMVEMALEKLSEKEIVLLDNEKKASMVSNLLVVLCGDKSASPIVNTGNH